LTTYTETKGSPIISYHLQYDAETNGAFWIDIIGNNAFYTSTSFILTYGLSPGRIYNFRVRALNLWGWGQFSEFSWIKSSTAPLAIPSISTSIDPSTGGVQVEWAAPYMNSETVIKYLIEVQD